jgi:hypothetical protein
VPVIAVATVVAAGFATASATDLSASLLVPAAATNVRTETRPNGQIEVLYVITEKYPADGFLAQVRAALPAPHWTPLQKDWLNPGIPSSHVRGWVHFTRNRKDKTEVWVHEWMAQWRNAAGDVSLYRLEYESPLPKDRDGYLSQPDNDRLQVVAVWIPAKLAERIQQAAGSVSQH